jgi:HlyD family secretion protein
MKRAIIIILVIAVIVGGVIGWRTYSAQKQQEELLASLEFATIEQGTLVATIGATGVVLSNQSALLTWQTSGSVEAVNVSIGDKVTKDQILASLAETSLPQTVILAQADLVSAQQALDDLMNSQLQQAQALQAVESAQQALDDLLNPELQQALALQAIADAQQAMEYYEQQVTNLNSIADQPDIDSAEAQVVLAKDALEKAQDKFEPYANKPEDNLSRARLQSELSAAQQQYDYAVRNRNAMLSTASATDIAVGAANLATAQAQLLQANRDYERIKDGPSEADIALLEAQLADAQREHERLKDGPDPDDIAVAEARISAAKATINQASITAPFDGIVTMVESKPGDQINPGTLAFRIDDLSRLLVDLEVSEVDVNQIKVGQDVTLSLDAVLAKEYQGTVIDVAMVGTDTQGVVNFTVTVELHDPDKDVRPGMTSAVNIVVKQLDETLLVPNRAVRVVEGERVVYMLKNGTFESVPVTLGASSDIYSQIVAGDLKAGDEIIINPPSILLMQQGGFSGPGGGMMMRP